MAKVSTTITMPTTTIKASISFGVNKTSNQSSGHTRQVQISNSKTNKFSSKSGPPISRWIDCERASFSKTYRKLESYACGRFLVFHPIDLTDCTLRWHSSHKTFSNCSQWPQSYRLLSNRIFAWQVSPHKQTHTHTLVTSCMALFRECMR